MKAKIDKDGLLRIKRNDTYKLQWCPHSPKYFQCGDWCPKFVETDSNNGIQKSRIARLMCVDGNGLDHILTADLRENSTGKANFESIGEI